MASLALELVVASGMFARLSSDELKRAVSSLYGLEAGVVSNFEWWRDQPQQLQRDFEPFVEYYGDEPSPRVRFDFQLLRQNRATRNGFFWAADTHNDWVANLDQLVAAAGNAEALVTQDLRSRR